MKLEIYQSGRKIREINTNLGDTLLQAISDAGVFLDAPCGGSGRCGKCLVRLKPDGEEVLACKTYTDGDMQVYLPDEGQMKIAETYPIHHSGLACPELDSGTRNPLNQQENQEGLQLGVAIDVGTTTVVASLIDCGTGRHIATASSVNAQRIYGADVISRIDYCAKHGHEKLTKLIRAQIEALTRQLFKKAGVGDSMQSQIKYIVIAGNTIMQHLVAELSPASMGAAPFTPISLFGMEAPAWEGLPVSSDAKIYYTPAISAYVGGDITAGLLFVESDGLARANFWSTGPEVNGQANSNFCSSGTEVNSQANPNFISTGNEVNGQTNSNFFATGEKVKNVEQTMLFLDIGTNGEMVLKHEGKYYSCATAAGPAFEGAQIEMGMAATSGAISQVLWDDTEKRLKLTVIGETTPIGICGSGLLAILAYLVENGKKAEQSDTEAPLPYVDEAGRLVNDTSSSDKFYLTDNVYITSQDIRKLQLAKAAIAAGIQTLIEYASITENQIATLVLAGGFGNYLDKTSASKIGLIPQSLLPVTRSAGNTALSGAAYTLCNKEAHQKLKSITQRTEYIELSTDKTFNEQFIEQMMF